MILQGIFLGIQPCFLTENLKSTMWRSIVLLSDDITHVKSRMVSPKTNMMCETFHKQDNKKKQTLEYLVDCTLNSKFSVQPVNGKSDKSLSLLRNSMCWPYKNSRFPPLSKFPNWLIMDWLDLADGFAVLTTDIVSCGSLAS